jgi:excinuclease ABC subunit C
MTSQQLAKLKLPDVPGVYIFRDHLKRPLYIGRATSLRDRTRSYFGVDLIDTRGPRIVDMVTKAKTATWHETDSVLEAVLLESQLIKRYQPFYNVDERDDKSSQYVIITEELWPRVFLARARDYDQAIKDKTLEYEVKRAFGPFVESGLIKEALRILRKLFPFKDKNLLIRDTMNFIEHWVARRIQPIHWHMSGTCVRSAGLFFSSKAKRDD